MKVRIERMLGCGRIDAVEEEWDGAHTAADVRRMAKVLYGQRWSEGDPFDNRYDRPVADGWVVQGIFGVRRILILTPTA